MTPPKESRKEALEIYGDIFTAMNWKGKDAAIQEIASALEAEREAGYLDGMEVGVNGTLYGEAEKWERRGYRRGLEDAARIANKEQEDKMWSENAIRCAGRIYALIRAKIGEVK